MGQLESSVFEEEGLKEGETILHGDVSLEGIAHAIRDGRIKKICVVSGAGISVAAGIPDFRTPGSGLYFNLEEYELPEPESLFDLQYFRNFPEKYYAYFMKTRNETFIPTYTHAFIRLLQEKGLLLRLYTQNIDNLEMVAGLVDNLVIKTHGDMNSCGCVDCKTVYSIDYMVSCIQDGHIPRCSCGGLIKPGIVFFGEPLPLRYTWCHQDDMTHCDLLIILGTSLSVEPVANLVEEVRDCTPRLLINHELVGPFRFCGMSSSYRDVAYVGECDNGVKELCSLLGWEKELIDMETRFIREASRGETPIDISLDSSYSEKPILRTCSCPSLLSDLETLHTVSLVTKSDWNNPVHWFNFL